MNYWLQISSGRGPEECCWVVANLARFLLQRAAKENFQAELINTVEGPRPDTFRSVLIALRGGEGLSRFATEWSGSVKWVGKSLFRPNHKRKNWFVSITTFAPIVMSDTRMQDIKIETMRSSGPGGQHTNKTESAVRVTDRVSGLSAVAQEERSQYLNKKLALARLHQALEDHIIEKKKQFEKSCWQQHNELERGNAIHQFAGPAFKLKK